MLFSFEVNNNFDKKLCQAVDTFGDQRMRGVNGLSTTKLGDINVAPLSVVKPSWMNGATQGTTPGGVSNVASAAMNAATTPAAGQATTGGTQQTQTAATRPSTGAASFQGNAQADSGVLHAGAAGFGGTNGYGGQSDDYFESGEYTPLEGFQGAAEGNGKDYLKRYKQYLRANGVGRGWLRRNRSQWKKQAGVAAWNRTQDQAQGAYETAFNNAIAQGADEAAAREVAGNSARAALNGFLNAKSVASAYKGSRYGASQMAANINRNGWRNSRYQAPVQAGDKSAAVNNGYTFNGISDLIKARRMKSYHDNIKDSKAWGEMDTNGDHDISDDEVNSWFKLRGNSGITDHTSYAAGKLYGATDDQFGSGPFSWDNKKRKLNDDSGYQFSSAGQDSLRNNNWSSLPEMSQYISGYGLNQEEFRDIFGDDAYNNGQWNREKLYDKIGYNPGRKYNSKQFALALGNFIHGLKFKWDNGRYVMTNKKGGLINKCDFGDQLIAADEEQRKRQAAAAAKRKRIGEEAKARQKARAEEASQQLLNDVGLSNFDQVNQVYTDLGLSGADNDVAKTRKLIEFKSQGKSSLANIINHSKKINVKTLFDGNDLFGEQNNGRYSMPGDMEFDSQTNLVYKTGSANPIGIISDGDEGGFLRKNWVKITPLKRDNTGSYTKDNDDQSFVMYSNGEIQHERMPGMFANPMKMNPMSLPTGVVLENANTVLPGSFKFSNFINNILAKNKFNTQSRNINTNYEFGESFKHGGSLKKFQQGGEVSQEAATQDAEQEQMVAALFGYIGAMSAQGTEVSAEEAMQTVSQIAQQDPSALEELMNPELIMKGAQFLQQKQPDVFEQLGGNTIMESLQSQIASAKRGAKLQFINTLKGNCPEGYEVKYMFAGGNMCPVCQRKKMQQIKQEKCGGKTLKKGGVSKTMDDIKAEIKKCGGKTKKK